MRVLTDPTGEDEGIDARERCRCGGDGGSRAPDEHVDRETRHRIAGRRATLDLPHVGRAGDGGEPGAMPQPVGQLLDGNPVGGKAEQDARIDRPGARAHHQPFVRREAHRGVHRATTVDRRDRATGAEVRDYERQILA